MRDEAQKICYEARVQAWKDYEEVVAQIVKRSEEDRDQARNDFNEVLAQIDKTYKEALDG
ncbi:unnamed protein product [marine sediment metagenome]|uniref:Uncharacterized protein n=1 Tax=marine sediment metagenome TaxID=412755 RepID=X1GC29_9ZZZZ